MNSVKEFVQRKVRDRYKQHFSKKDIKDLADKPFVIISNNCWGGEVYQWYQRPYNSPFIGLFIYGPCYHKLLNNFDHYMDQPLEFIEKSKYPEPHRDWEYPIARLDDIEIHFSHYKSKEEALEKWERRKRRMKEVTDKDDYYFKICDRDGNDKFMKSFHELPYRNKISYALPENVKLERDNHLILKHRDKKQPTVPNGKKQFKLTFLYFDLHQWLKS